jgi:hypothetical protein
MRSAIAAMKSSIHWLFVPVLLFGSARDTAAQQFFARSPELALTTGSRGGSWTTLDGELGGGVDACVDPGGTTYVVTRGMNGEVWLKRRIGGAWQVWEPIGGQITADPSVACSADGAVGVFGRGPAADVIFKVFDPANPTAPFTSLGAEIVGGPDATSSARGRFDVAVRGTDNAIWYTGVVGGRAEGWRPLGGQFTSDPAILAVQRAGKTYLEVFGRWTDRALWHGAVEASGPTTFISRGAELGGSPDATSSAPQRMEIAVRGTDNQVWLLTFDGGQWSWNPMGGRTDADVAIVSASAGVSTTPPPPDRPAGAAARFRVTFTGFHVERETIDDVIERDGARDEVFFVPAALIVNRDASVPFSHPGNLITPVVGQRRDSQTVQGGTATATGGLTTGDNFPARPWEGAPAIGQLSTVFEGVLRQGENAAVLLPTLWEWDGGDPGPSSSYIVALQERFSAAARIVAEMIPNPRIAAQTSTFVLPGHNTGFGRLYRWDGGPANRPIGVVRTGNREVTFVPQAVVLTYEAADLITRSVLPDTTFFAPRRPGQSGSDALFEALRSRPDQLGFFTVTYNDDEEFQGRYILYFKVERCRSLDSCR